MVELKAAFRGHVERARPDQRPKVQTKPRLKPELALTLCDDGFLDRVAFFLLLNFLLYFFNFGHFFWLVVVGVPAALITESHHFWNERAERFFQDITSLRLGWASSLNISAHVGDLFTARADHHHLEFSPFGENVQDHDRLNIELLHYLSEFLFARLPPTPIAKVFTRDAHSVCRIPDLVGVLDLNVGTGLQVL